MKDNYSLKEAAGLLRMTVARLKKFADGGRLDVYRGRYPLAGSWRNKAGVREVDCEPRVTRTALLEFSVENGFPVYA